MNPMCQRAVFVTVALGLQAPVNVFAANQRGAPPAIDQAVIARNIRSDDPAVRAAAVDAAKAIGPSNTGEELRAALVGLLERLNAIVAQADRRQLPLDAVIEPEFVADVQRTVASLKEPDAIPALAEALGMFTIIRDLAAFGDLAVAPVVAGVTRPSSHYSVVDDGLRVLRLIVERRATTPVSVASLDRIRQATRERITGQ